MTRHPLSKTRRQASADRCFAAICGALALAVAVGAVRAQMQDGPAAVASR